MESLSFFNCIATTTNPSFPIATTPNPSFPKEGTSLSSSGDRWFPKEGTSMVCFSLLPRSSEVGGIFSPPPVGGVGGGCREVGRACSPLLLGGGVRGGGEKT